MTNPATIQLKLIAALIEAIDADDPKDADQAIRMIRTILESGERKS